MEKEHKDIKTRSSHKEVVHYVLINSYSVFLVAIIFGVFFDAITKTKIFSNYIYQNIGLLMLFVGPIIIYWAQATSSNYKKRIIKDETRSPFGLGPYRFLRSPTHFGLFILTFGFGLVINSLYSVIFTIIAYFITKLFFLKKEEKILEKKYGQVYIDYKKKVKNWI